MTTRQPAESTLRSLLIVFNVIFWFSGLGILGLGIWQFITTDDMRAAIEHAQFEITTYLLIVSGAAVVVVGIIGCMAIFGANRCLLAFYSTCVFLLCMANIAACIKTFLMHNEISTSVKYRLSTTIKYRYLLDEESTTAVDQLQQKFKCCGINGHTDWKDTAFNFRAQTLARRGYYPYPVSCCLDTNNCNLKLSNASSNPDIYKQGCQDTVLRLLDLLLTLVGWSTLGLSAFLIICGTMACCYRVAVN